MASGAGAAQRRVPPRACMSVSSGCSPLSPPCRRSSLRLLRASHLDRGLDRLFSTRTRSAVENSLIVAEAYLRDHAQFVRSDIMIIAFEIARSKTVFEQDPDKLRQFLTFQAAARGLGAAIVIDKDLKVIARANVNINQTFALPPRDALAHITAKEPQIVLLPDANYVAAIIKLEQFDDTYLYVTRLLDPRVVPQLQATRASVTEYAALEARRIGVQVAFALMYTVIALIVLLSAVWIGFNFANRLVAPIRRLIGAANAVSTGNLYVRVPVRQAEGDLAHLGETLQPHDPGIAYTARRHRACARSSWTAAGVLRKPCSLGPARASSASTARAM